MPKAKGKTHKAKLSKKFIAALGQIEKEMLRRLQRERARAAKACTCCPIHGRLRSDF